MRSTSPARSFSLQVIWLNRVIRIEGLAKAPILKSNDQILVGCEVISYIKEVIFEITSLLMPCKQNLSLTLVRDLNLNRKALELKTHVKKRTSKELAKKLANESECEFFAVVKIKVLESGCDVG